MIDLWFGLICAIGGLIAGYTYGKYLHWFTKPIVLKTIPREEAKQKILDYIEEGKGKWTSDIIFDLELEVDLVLSILTELFKEGLIDPQSSLGKANKNE